MSKTKNILGFGSGGTVDASSADTTDMGFKAGGTILPGMIVMIDTTDKTGKTVIAAATGSEQLMCGVYQGEGGSGAASTNAVLGPGAKTAASGDYIFVRVTGFCLVSGAPFNTSALITPPVLLVPNAKTDGYAMELSTTVIGISSMIKWANWPIFSVSSAANVSSLTTATMGAYCRFM